MKNDNEKPQETPANITANESLWATITNGSGNKVDRSVTINLIFAGEAPADLAAVLREAIAAAFCR